MLFHWQICCTVTPKRIAMPERTSPPTTVVHIGTFRILLPIAVAAGNFVEFFFVNSHCSFLL